MTNRKFGVDISKYNGNVNMRVAKQNGVEFVILKAGSGARGEDPYFQTNYKNAKAAGIPVGAYWYSYAMNVNEAKGEAKRFMKLLDGKQFEYPVYLDFEDPSQRNISRSTKTDMAIAFMDILEKNGYYTGLYSSGDWINNKFDRARMKNYDVWIAHWYVNTPRCYRSYGMWQYTNRKQVPGVPSTGEGGVDSNYAFIDYPIIIKNAGLNGYAKPQPKSGGDNMKNKNIIIAYWNDGDLANAQALLNSLQGAALVKTKDASIYKEDYVIQVGGFDIKGSNRKVFGRNRVATLEEVTKVAKELKK